MENMENPEVLESRPAVRQKRRGFWSGMITGTLITLIVMALVLSVVAFVRYQDRKSVV